MKPQETVDYHIKATWHSITRMYNQIATRHDLSQTIGYVLINVEKEGTPATKIAPLMGMEPTSLSRLLKNMEENGLIYRKGDPYDKRVVRIYLTEEGVRKKKISKEVILNFNKLVQEKIDFCKLQAFFDVIMQINELTKDYDVNRKIDEFINKQ